MKKLMLVTSVIAVSGCMVTTISKDYSVDEVESSEKLSFNKVDNLDDIESFDKSAIPVVVKAESKKEQVHSPSGIHGLLWLCTLGIIPSWQTEAETHTMNVATPLGKKNGVCTVTKRQYLGWVPYMLPFSSSNEDAQCEEELLSRLVSQWKGEWTADKVEKMNAANSERIKALRARADALLAQKKYVEVMDICKTARSKSFVAEYMPKAKAILKQDVEVAMQNKDYKRVIDMLKNEKGGSELGVKRSAAIINLIVDNANDATIDNLLKEYAGELSLPQLAEIERKSADNAVKSKLAALQASMIEASDRKIEAEIKEFVASRKSKSDRRGVEDYRFGKSDAEHLAGLLSKISNPKVRTNAFKNLPYDIMYGNNYMLLNCLIETADSPAILWWMIEEIAISHRIGEVERKLLSMLDKVTDDQMIEKILFARSRNGGMRLVNQPAQKMLLLKKLPEKKMIDIALEGIKKEPDKYNVDRLDENWDLTTAANVAAIVKDSGHKVKLVATILSRAYLIKKICIDEPMYIWSKENQSEFDRIVASLPKLSEMETGSVLSLAGDGGRLIMDSISPEIAKRILISGKKISVNVETELAGKVAASDIDLNLYHAVKSDDARKILSAKMPDSVKAALKAESEKVFAAIMKKAKEAAKSTFELNGFYLGMTMDEAKAVYMHHFPDGDMKMSNDGFSLYVSGQRDPLCKIYTDTKVVYQLNFGKKMLKKWYSYDVQTFMEWARAYSRENKIDMRYKEIEKEATVTEPMDWSRSYRVWFHQESYQYKHNTKDYRLTYFGEEKDFTVHGGLGGALIKELAAPQFKSVRGDAGTLRATIEDD